AGPELEIAIANQARAIRSEPSGRVAILISAHPDPVDRTAQVHGRNAHARRTDTDPRRNTHARRTDTNPGRNTHPRRTHADC
ncbi:MAG: hypothetical protein KAY12_01525, partial [Arenimonas sp.]|nr:hypothetical protein [Arenimonas sp.]